MGWINHMHVMYAYPIQTHTCIHNTYVCQVLFCSKKREKSPPSSLSAHKSANAFSINTHTHMLMSICDQIIKRPGNGIAATNTVECLIKGACNLQYSIFTSLSRFKSLFHSERRAHFGVSLGLFFFDFVLFQGFNI